MEIKQYSKNEEFLGNLEDVTKAHHFEELNGANYIEIECAEEVFKGERLLYKDTTNSWQEFIISGVESDRDESGIIYKVYAEHSIYETWGDYHESVDLPNATADSALTKALQPTRWSLGTVNVTGRNPINFTQISAREAMQKIVQIWGGELQYRVELLDNEIISREVDLVTERGFDLGKRFTYTKDLTDISKIVQRENVVTALYGYGKTLERDNIEGETPRLTFGVINNGKNYVEDNEARLLWGRNSSNGKVHVFDKVIFDDVEEPHRLKELTLERLQKMNTPIISYEADVVDLKAFGFEHEGVTIGDNVIVIDKDFTPELRLKARVIEFDKDLLYPEDNHIVLGNFIPALSDSWNELSGVIDQFKGKKDIWNRAETINPDGTIDTTKVNKLIDGLNKEMNALGGYLYLSEDGEGLITYDKPIDANPQMAIQIKGGMFRIAASKLPNGDWDWRTFGTGEGFIADYIKAGILKSQTGDSWINMENGHFKLGGVTYDDRGFGVHLDSGIDLDQKLTDLENGIDENKPTYTWIMFADDQNGSGISADPTGKNYVGFASNKEVETPSNDPEDYGWVLVTGHDGETPVIGYLTSETHVLPADADGKVYSYQGAETEFKLFYGQQESTELWNVTIEADAGVQITQVGNKATVTSLLDNQDTGTVSFTATRSGFPTITKKFTVTKAKKGYAANAYTLQLNTKIIKKDKQGGLTPNKIVLNAFKYKKASEEDEEDQILPYEGKFKIDISYNGIDYVNEYTTTTWEHTKEFVLPANVVSTKIYLISAGSDPFAVPLYGVLDKETVLVLEDGVDGQDGIDGTSPTVGILSSDSHVFPATSEGKITSYEGASTTLKIFEGENDVTSQWGLSYTTSENDDNMWVRQTESTFEVYMLQDSIDEAYVDITAMRSGHANIVKRFSVTKAKKGYPANAYSLQLDWKIVKESQLPQVITMKAFKYQKDKESDDDTLIAYEGKFRVETSTDGVNFTKQYATGTWESVKTFTIPSGVVAAKFYLIGASSDAHATPPYNILDQENITIVYDGVDGVDGVDGSDGLDGRPGEDGTSVKIIGSVGSVSELPDTAEEGDGYLINGVLWIWQSTKFVEVGNLRGPSGTDGQDGTGIANHMEKYAISQHNMGDKTEDWLISNLLWQDTPPQTTEDKPYLWNYEIIEYTKNLPTRTELRIIGTQGRDGRGLESTDRFFKLTNSNVAPVIDDTWSTSPLDTTIYQRYLWAYEIYTWNKNPLTTYSDPFVITIHGRDGQDGTDGIDGDSGPKGDPGEKGDPGKGINKIRKQYYRSTNPNTPSGGSWSYEPWVYLLNTYIFIRDEIVWSDTIVGHTEAARDRSLEKLANDTYNAQIQIDDMLGQIDFRIFEEGNLISNISGDPSGWQIKGENIDLVGSVNVLSEITGRLGDVTAGSISGSDFITKELNGEHVQIHTNRVYVGEARSNHIFPKGVTIGDNSVRLTHQKPNNQVSTSWNNQEAGDLSLNGGMLSCYNVAFDGRLQGETITDWHIGAPSNTPYQSPVEFWSKYGMDIDTDRGDFKINGEIVEATVYEMGKNSTGHYIKFHNGLMVCWVEGVSQTNIGFSGSRPYRMYTDYFYYPASFKGTPTNYVTGDFGELVSFGMRDVYTIRARYVAYSYSQITNDFTLNILSIGRWK